MQGLTALSNAGLPLIRLQTGVFYFALVYLLAGKEKDGLGLRASRSLMQVWTLVKNPRAWW